MKIQSMGLVALTALTIAAAPLAAQGAVTVKYADLDLSKPADLEKLDQRIEQAARDVCGINDAQTGSRMASREARKCLEQAEKAVHAQFAGRIEQAQKAQKGA